MLQAVAAEAVAEVEAEARGREAQGQLARQAGAAFAAGPGEGRQLAQGSCEGEHAAPTLDSKEQGPADTLYLPCEDDGWQASDDGRAASVQRCGLAAKLAAEPSAPGFSDVHGARAPDEGASATRGELRRMQPLRDRQPLPCPLAQSLHRGFPAARGEL